MRKLLQRVFGRGPDDNASPSGPLAPEAYDQLVGENALLELVFERGLGDLIVARLKALEGWPFDLGDALFEDEKLILNLWGFSRAVMNIRAVSIEEGQAFLDRIHHDFVYPKLLKASTQTLEDCFQLRTFSARTVERYPEYEAAYRRNDEVPKRTAPSPRHRAARTRPALRAGGNQKSFRSGNRRCEGNVHNRNCGDGSLSVLRRDVGLGKRLDVVSKSWTEFKPKVFDLPQ